MTSFPDAINAARDAPVHPCGVLADGTTRTPRTVNYDYATGATRPQEYVTCPECIAADAAHRAACARAR